MWTEVWAARVERDLTEEEGAAMLAALPAERRDRLMRLRPALRREPLCAWTLLRMMLWRRLGWTRLPDVALMEYGKPWFPDFPGVHFNLSHTSGAVLAGLSEAPIGVDVEKVRPVRERVMRRVAGVDSPEEFFRRWVALEAMGKRGGRGVAAMLEEGRALWGDAYYRPLDLFPGYAAGAAVSPGQSFPAVRLFTV